MPKKPKKASPYESTRIPNLYRAIVSGEYVSRPKQPLPPYNRTTQRLGTTVFSVAEVRHNEHMAQFRREGPSRTEAVSNQQTVEEALTAWGQWMNETTGLKPSTKMYYRSGIKRLRKICSFVLGLRVRMFTRDHARQVKERLKIKCTSHSAVNGGLIVCKETFNRAVEQGLRTDDPFATITCLIQEKRAYELPSIADFHTLCATIQNAGVPHCKLSADMVRAFAYSGVRKMELRWLKWSDIDFDFGTVTVKGDPVGGNKGGRIVRGDRGERTIPLVPKFKELLLKMKSKAKPAPEDYVFQGQSSCLKALTKGCKVLGLPRLTHHALRHLFTTLCVESGVPNATVAAILGHKDGGKLVSQTYHHFRLAHASEQMAKVNFDGPALGKVTSITVAVA